jgi:3-mercaptopyruvate sulfurtransferase SseA
MEVLMRSLISFLAVALLALVVLTACNSAEWRNAKTAAPPASVPTPADGVRRVTIAELKEMLANNQAFVIDVRNQASYDAGHIKGSRLIPEAEVKNHSDEFPKDQFIVTYCS